MCVYDAGPSLVWRVCGWTDFFEEMTSYLQPKSRGGLPGKEMRKKILENGTACEKVLSGKECSGRNESRQVWWKHG